MSRDRDVRNAIQTALMATGAFDAVWIWGLPEGYGSGASQLAAAAIEPASGRQDDDWDTEPTGALRVTGLLTITLLYRHEDPQLRDENADLIFNQAANAINGQSLAGLTLPARTKFVSWRYQPPTPPERRITATFSYQYLVEGWTARDTTE